MHFIYLCSQDMSLDSEGRQRGGAREKRGLKVYGWREKRGREVGRQDKREQVTSTLHGPP